MTVTELNAGIDCRRGKNGKRQRSSRIAFLDDMPDASATVMAEDEADGDNDDDDGGGDGDATRGRRRVFFREREGMSEGSRSPSPVPSLSVGPSPPSSVRQSLSHAIRMNCFVPACIVRF